MPHERIKKKVHGSLQNMIRCLDLLENALTIIMHILCDFFNNLNCSEMQARKLAETENHHSTYPPQGKTNDITNRLELQPRAAFIPNRQTAFP